jgi:formyltetrahydrofolate deformylase
MTELVLTLSCPDRTGIVHAVSAYLHESGCNVLDAQQFGDRTTGTPAGKGGTPGGKGGTFFMRVHVETDRTRADLAAGFAATAADFGMDWELHDLAVKPRALILVSKAGHCLNDLLYRITAERLSIDVPLVAGNHPDLAPLAAAHGIGFEHIPVGDSLESKQAAEERIAQVILEKNIDFIILARYMRILSPELCAKLPGRIINIHHSFLPSFKGARPYHQAHAHGVKLIGATAHYVTADLDEGPIIEQEVARVDHTSGPEDLAAIGRDAERIALARAVRWHAEHRVLLHGRRTVIFK